MTHNMNLSMPFDNICFVSNGMFNIICESWQPLFLLSILHTFSVIQCKSKKMAGPESPETPDYNPYWGGGRGARNKVE